MKQEELENKLTEMKKCEFLQSEQFNTLDSKTAFFIKEMNDVFGYNDGEPLDEDGIEFVIQLMKYKWMLANAVCEE